MRPSTLLMRRPPHLSTLLVVCMSAATLTLAGCASSLTGDTYSAPKHAPSRACRPG